MMTFEPQQVLSEEHWERLLCENLGYNQNESIDLGSLDFVSVPDLITSFFEVWTRAIDKKVKISEVLLESKYGELYRWLVYERGFTFEEFKTLFDSEIDELEYPYYPIYEFLQITTQEERKYLANKYQNDVESYCELIQSCKLTGADFFLKRLKSQLPLSALKKHCYISGKSGSGKSSLMLSMFYHLQKISTKKQGHALVLIDPHGDLAEEVVSLKLNKDNSNRLVYIDPCLAKGYTPVLNPFELKDKSDETVELTAQMLVAVFEELLGDAGLTMYMSAVLFPCITTLLKMDGATLADLQTFMNDEQNQHLVDFALKHNNNPNHIRFFKTAFYDKMYEKTKLAIYTRTNSLLNTQLFYNAVIGKSTIDLETAIDQGKVIVVNASKGRLGLQASSAFGRFVIANLQSIAIRRATKEKRFRKPCFCFIDECQNFLTKSISIILTEARKYGVHLLLANQTVSDLGDHRDNVLNNTDVKLIGRNGNKSLSILARETGVSVDKLLALPKFSFYARVGDVQPFMFQASSMLVKEQWGSGKYYLTKEELEQQKQYFINNSGYYTQVQTVSETSYTDTKLTREVKPTFKPKFDQ
ncbi:type IV secretory system conjugative DNA transfer family protein [Aureispira sp. CCB-QB1]|uniref:type IV secretory system conjugative DNA transfer family protein n=1 Tax=Aureispira sp. CCB-QB1 TaxID=1313421 RepID=UPI000695BD0C|nr:type IV secretory system conjugative DNA transfer family protein [Aureispira sp. CCB-QB1]